MKRHCHHYGLYCASWPAVPNSVKNVAVVLTLFVCGGTSVAADLPRLRVSDNQRYLVAEDGRPFFWLGDTAWSIIDQSVRESSYDQPGVEKYFQVRKEQGFNVLQTHFLTNLVRGPIGAPNAYQQTPFVDGDFTRPRVIPGPANDYWDHADYVIDLAARYGMYVAIVAVWSNSLETDGHPLVRDPDVAYRYGHFLGDRYRDRTHMIWLLGGDAFGKPDRKTMSPARLRMTRALAEGIADGVNGVDRHDGRADWSTALMFYHPPGGGKSSSLFLHDQPWLDFNMIQTTTKFRFRNYETVAADYARRPPKPTLDGEAAYEYSLPLNQRALRQRPGDRIAPSDVRRAAYWSVLAGGFGFTYGHRNLIGWVCRGEPPLKHGADRPWFESLETPAAQQMRHLKNLILSRPMLIRVPDQSLIVGEPGEGERHIQAARAADGSYALVYIPKGNGVTIDLGKLSGEHVVAYWYDPRTGQSTRIGTTRRRSQHRFSTASNEKGKDWVLVLDDASRRFPPPGTKWNPNNSSGPSE